MWVIVAVSLSFGDTPKVTLVPGPEYQSKSECIQAIRVKGNFDSQGGGLEFSFCVPKGSLEIGQQSGPEKQ